MKTVSTRDLPSLTRSHLQLDITVVLPFIRKIQMKNPQPISQTRPGGTESFLDQPEALDEIALPYKGTLSLSFLCSFPTCIHRC